MLGQRRKGRQEREDVVYRYGDTEKRGKERKKIDAMGGQGGSTPVFPNARRSEAADHRLT